MRKRSLAFSLIAAAAVLAGTIDFAGAAQAAGRPLCRPALAFTDVQFSPMQPPTMERRWSATVLVDASGCAKNSAGYFEILFSRLKENAPEIALPRGIHVVRVRLAAAGRAGRVGFFRRRGGGGILVRHRHAVPVSQLSAGARWSRSEVIRLHHRPAIGVNSVRSGLMSSSGVPSWQSMPRTVRPSASTLTSASRFGLKRGRRENGRRVRVLSLKNRCHSIRPKITA